MSGANTCHPSARWMRRSAACFCIPSCGHSFPARKCRRACRCWPPRLWPQAFWINCTKRGCTSTAPLADCGCLRRWTRTALPKSGPRWTPSAAIPTPQSVSSSCGWITALTQAIWTPSLPQQRSTRRSSSPRRWRTGSPISTCSMAARWTVFPSRTCPLTPCPCWPMRLHAARRRFSSL